MIKQCRFLQLQLLKCSGAHKSSVCLLLPVHEPGTGLAPHCVPCSSRQQHPVQVGCGVCEAFGPATLQCQDGTWDNRAAGCSAWSEKSHLQQDPRQSQELLSERSSGRGMAPSTFQALWALPCNQQFTAAT